MNLGAAAELTREIAGAGRALVRLARFDPLWHEGLDLSASGFVRSFFPPVLALPFFLVFNVLFITRGGAETVETSTLWAYTLSHLFAVFGYPLLVAAAARPLGFSAGYRPFVIVANWSVLFVSVGACALAPLTLIGRAGVGFIAPLWMLLFALRVFVIWRAARTALSNDFAPALLMVVLLVATELAAAEFGSAVHRLLT